MTSSSAFGVRALQSFFPFVPSTVVPLTQDPACRLILSAKCELRSHLGITNTSSSNGPQQSETNYSHKAC
jgi:hypothetical protein